MRPSHQARCQWLSAGGEGTGIEMSVAAAADRGRDAVLGESWRGGRRSGGDGGAQVLRPLSLLLLVLTESDAGSGGVNGISHGRRRAIVPSGQARDACRPRVGKDL